MSPWELGEGDGRSNKHEELPWGKHTKRRGKWKTIWKTHENPCLPLEVCSQLVGLSKSILIYQMVLPSGELT